MTLKNCLKRTLCRTNHDLAFLYFYFRFLAKMDLFPQKLGNADALRVSNLDKARLHHGTHHRDGNSGGLFDVWAPA